MINKLENAEWFADVGRPFQVNTPAINQIYPCSSWDEAISNCSSLEWENTQLEAANLLRTRVNQIDPVRFSGWNDLVDILKPIAVDLIFRKVHSVMVEKNFPESFRHNLEWDILHLFLETEYSDIIDPVFYVPLAYWYSTGRFPCGWRGTFPDGQLMVF
jgi:hypothetical protein